MNLTDLLEAVSILMSAWAFGVIAGFKVQSIRNFLKEAT